jgi:hypothetical protein
VKDMTMSKADLRDSLRQRYVRTPVAIADAAAASSCAPAPTTSERAFVLHAESGRTVITAPIREVASLNGAYTYLTGRLVGADTPNANGALWSSADLELGQNTVAGGPLNWLHDDQKIIGCLLDGEFTKADREGAAEGIGNHIVSSSAVWRFLFQKETATIQSAAKNGELYYSMECVSREVACVDSPGRPGCGAQFGYADYDAGNCCSHLRERSSIRRFVDPLFLGAAVIVPPVKPGWAQANVELARQAASQMEGQSHEDQARDVAAAILGWANRV